MNFDKIKVSQVLQVIEEDLKFNKALILHNPRKKSRLHDAFKTVSNTYNELFDLDYTPVDMTINEFANNIASVPSKIFTWLSNEVEKTKEYQKKVWSESKLIKTKKD